MDKKDRPDPSTTPCDDPSTCGWYRGIEADLACAKEAIGVEALAQHDGYVHEWCRWANSRIAELTEQRDLITNMMVEVEEIAADAIGLQPGCLLTPAEMVSTLRRYYESKSKEVDRIRDQVFGRCGCRTGGIKDVQGCLECDHHDTVICLVDGERIWDDTPSYMRWKDTPSLPGRVMIAKVRDDWVRPEEKPCPHCGAKVPFQAAFDEATGKWSLRPTGLCVNGHASNLWTECEDDWPFVDETVCGEDWLDLGYSICTLVK